MESLPDIPAIVPTDRRDFQYAEWWFGRFERLRALAAEVVRTIRERCPRARVVLHAILPSGERPDDAKRLRDARVNERIRLLADGRNVLWCDFGPKLLEPDGNLAKETAHDFVHLTEKGYEIWTAALLPYLDRCPGLSGEPP